MRTRRIPMNLFHALSRSTAALAFAVFIGSQLSVCSSGLAASIDVDNVRSSLMLKSEPAGAMTPTAAKAAVAKAPKQLVIAGRIAGSKGMDPFVKGKASFAMLQIGRPDPFPALRRCRSTAQAAVISASRPVFEGSLQA